MQAWEHKRLHLEWRGPKFVFLRGHWKLWIGEKEPISDDHVWTDIARLGSEGWQLAGVSGLSLAEVYQETLWFKRPMELEADGSTAGD